MIAGEALVWPPVSGSCWWSIGNLAPHPEAATGTQSEDAAKCQHPVMLTARRQDDVGDVERRRLVWAGGCERAAGSRGFALDPAHCRRGGAGIPARTVLWWVSCASTPTPTRADVLAAWPT